MAEHLITRIVSAGMNSAIRKIIVGCVIVAIGAVGGPWAYINVVKKDAPDLLTLEPSVTTTLETSTSTVVESSSTTTAEISSTTVAAPRNLDGVWSVAGESIVGYRVKEIIVGQSTEGVGRTSVVTGSLKISGQEVTEAQFTVDMTTLKSDSSRRDSQVNGRILDTTAFPTATFVLTKPIKLTAASFVGEDLAIKTTGSLTLRGVKKDVNVALVARLVDDFIKVNGSIELVFADWSIPDPSIAAIVVEDRGLLEFLIRFSR